MPLCQLDPFHSFMHFCAVFSSILQGIRCSCWCHIQQVCEAECPRQGCKILWSSLKPFWRNLTLRGWRWHFQPFFQTSINADWSRCWCQIQCVCRVGRHGYEIKDISTSRLLRSCSPSLTVSFTETSPDCWDIHRYKRKLTTWIEHNLNLFWLWLNEDWSTRRVYITFCHTYSLQFSQTHPFYCDKQHSNNCFILHNQGSLIVVKLFL